MANFANATKLAEHFFDHGPEFGVRSEAEYLKLANDFFNRPFNPSSMVQYTRSRFDVVRYDKNTGEFGVKAKDDMTIRTFFKPIPCRQAAPAIVALNRCHPFADNEEYFDQECSKW